MGESVELSCTVLTIDSKTKYRWFFSRDANSEDLGSLIDLSRYQQPPFDNPAPGELPKVTFTLRLENLTESDSGIYSCQAENRIGNDSLKTNLTVTQAPFTPGITGFFRFLHTSVIVVILAMEIVQ